MEKGKSKKIIGISCLAVLVVVAAVVLTMFIVQSKVSKLPIPELTSAKGTEDHKVIVKWQMSEGADGYTVYRKLEGEDWTAVTTIENSKQNSYTDSDVLPGTVYYYTVSALEQVDDKYKNSKYNKEGIAALTAVDAPKVSSVELLDDQKVEIVWQAVENADGYSVYRKAEDGEEEEIAMIPDGTVTSFVDIGNKSNSKYTYTVKAYAERPDMERAWSAYSKTDATILAGLDTPKMKFATRLGGSWVRVTWEPVPEAEGYCVYKMEDGEWVEKGSVAECGWLDEDAVKAVKTYSVKAFKKLNNTTIYSDLSDSVDAGSVERTEESLRKIDYWIGDTRTVYLGQNLGFYVKSYGLIGANYQWYTENADAWIRNVLDEKPDATLILNFGMDDVEDRANVADKYIEKYKQLMEDYPEANLWFMSINPVDTKTSFIGTGGASVQETDAYVKKFNEKLKEAFPERYIDAYNYLLKTGFITLDGIQYSYDTSEKIFWFVLAWV